MSGENLLAMLRRAAAGEGPDLIYAEEVERFLDDPEAVGTDALRAA